MDLPDIVWGNINISYVLYVLIFALTFAMTLIKIFGKKSKPEDAPGSNPYCKAQKEQVEKLERFVSETHQKLEDLKDKLNEKDKEILMLQNSSELQNKTLNEIRQSNRELVVKIESLLEELAALIDQS